MTKTLKEYAELLNNTEYCGNFDERCMELLQDMKEDSVVVAYGCSDDLLELDGALYEEYDCYNDTKLLWFGKQFINEHKFNELLDYVDDEIPMLYDSIKSMLKLDNLPFIHITHPKDAQFAYETNFPCEYFNIMEDGKLYCKGFVFKLESLKNKGENNE